jgi:hypothetical protein
MHALPGRFPLGKNLSVDGRRPHQAQENNGRHPKHGSLNSFNGENESSVVGLEEGGTLPESYSLKRKTPGMAGGPG